MPRSILGSLFLLLVVFSLASCASATKPTIDTANLTYVSKVSVEAAGDLPTTRLASFTKIATQLEASRYGAAGTPKEIRVKIRTLHYMDPLSAVFGSSNEFESDVLVVDINTGGVEAEFPYKAVYLSKNNFIAGAYEAQTQNKGFADMRLAAIFASEVMEKIYGSEAATAARKRPVPGAPPKPMNDIELLEWMAKRPTGAAS